MSDPAPDGVGVVYMLDLAYTDARSGEYRFWTDSAWSNLDAAIERGRARRFTEEGQPLDAEVTEWVLNNPEAWGVAWYRKDDRIIRKKGGECLNLQAADSNKCPKCGSQSAVLEDFHGEMFALCAGCGAEIGYDAE